MKNLICFLALLFFILPSFGQKKTESVIASSGNTIIADCGSMDWLVGSNLIDHEVLFGVTSSEVFPSPSANEHFTAYPTITRDKFFIESNKSINEDLLIRMVDLTGRILLLKQWEENPSELDLDDCASGTYFLQVIDKEEIPVATFVVVKE